MARDISTEHKELEEKLEERRAKFPGFFSQWHGSKSYKEDFYRKLCYELEYYLGKFNQQDMTSVQAVISNTARHFFAIYTPEYTGVRDSHLETLRKIQSFKNRKDKEQFFKTVSKGEGTTPTLLLDPEFSEQANKAMEEHKALFIEESAAETVQNDEELKQEKEEQTRLLIEQKTKEIYDKEREKLQEHFTEILYQIIEQNAEQRAKELLSRY